MQNGGIMDTGYKDHVCTICYDIFIFPVRLPCSHRFCKSCFDKHIENNTMSCPICRYRVSNWLRQLRRNNADIVDKPFWDSVQKLYPEEVGKRINGHVDYETSPTVIDTPTRRLAKQGEIQQEYKQFLQKELEEKKREDEENFRLSEAIIRMIEEEEKREEEERLQQLLKDEELARRLEGENAAESDISSDVVLLEDTDLSSLSLPSDCCTPRRGSLASLDSSSTSKQHLDPSTPSTSKEICTQPSIRLDTQSTSKDRNQSSIRPNVQSTSKENVFAKFFAAGSSTPSSSHINDNKLSLQEITSKDSKCSSISNKELSHFAPVLPGPSNVTNGPKSKNKKESVVVSSRCSSGCDSIGQELNHFKPIRTSPTTPPKDGSRGAVPKVVVAQRGVTVPDLNILPLTPLDFLAADVSLDELETSINLEKQLEEDRRLAMEIQNQLNEEFSPAKADYNLRKRKRPSGNLKKKVLLDRSQTTLDNLLIK